MVVEGAMMGVDDEVVTESGKASKEAFSVGRSLFVSSFVQLFF